MGGKKAHPVHRAWHWEKDNRLETWKGFDWPSIRRGRQVYTEVFAPCHMLGKLTFTHFQGFMTREEIKQLAAQYDIVEKEPDMEGNYVPRKGKPTDELPAPYPNQRAAQFANNGAEPPDLQTAAFCKEGGVDYIFSLVTGYNWGNGNMGIPLPPFFQQLKPGQFFNPYFKGCLISMPPPLSDGLIDFEDGTPATTSQMAKDVCNFLRWSAEFNYDERRLYFWKYMMTIVLCHVFLFHYQQKNQSWFYYQRWTYRYWKKTY